MSTESPSKSSAVDVEKKSASSCSLSITNQVGEATSDINSIQQGDRPISASNCETLYCTTQGTGLISTGALPKLKAAAHSCTDYVVNDNSDDECFRRNSLITVEPGLVYHRRERLRLKDFSNEVRAAMDVEQFVYEAEIMLDMSEVSVEDIVEAMLRKVSDLMNNSRVCV